MKYAANRKWFKLSIYTFDDPAVRPLDIVGRYLWIKILCLGCVSDGQVVISLKKISEKELGEDKARESLKIMHNQNLLTVQEWKINIPASIASIINAAMGDKKYSELTDIEKAIVKAHGGMKLIKIEAGQNVAELKKGLVATIKAANIR